MSDALRGITCPDKTRIVREALQGGWEWVGWDGGTHFVIRWPKTGEELRSGATPSVASWKRLAKDIERVSGANVWRRGNKKRSRKSTRYQADPEVEASRRRHAQNEERRLAALDAEQKARTDREAEIKAIQAAERRRREIEELMR